MFLAILLFFIITFANLCLRFIIRTKISSKAWERYRSHNFIGDWFMISFLNIPKYKVPLHFHLVFFINGIISFVFSLLFHFLNCSILESVANYFLILGCLWVWDSMVIFAYNLHPREDIVYRKVEAAIVISAFTILLAIITVFLTVAIIKDIV